MKKSSPHAGRRRIRLAAQAAAVVTSALLPAGALAHTARLRSCDPSNPAFAASLHAQGVPCSEARAIERHAANHGWRSPFRLAGRRWHATTYRRLHLHTEIRFQSGRQIVWIDAAKPAPKAGLPLGGGCCTATPTDGYLAGATAVTQADGSTTAIARERVGNRVRTGSGATASISAITSTTLAGAGMLLITLEDGDQLIASLDAKISSVNGSLAANEFQPGDELRTSDGTSRIATISMGRYSGEADQLQLDGPTGTFIANGIVVG